MLIIGGKIISWDTNEILENKALLIKDGVIKKIDEQSKMKEMHPDEELLDAKGQYIMPGNICAHTHFYGAFSRGMAIPGTPPKDFPEILSRLWWKLDKALDHESSKHSAYLGIIDAIRHGTTTVFDHHASFSAIDGSLDAIYEAVGSSGIRASLCFESSDREGCEKSEASLRENARFLEFVHRESPLYGRLSATFGLHASLSLSEKTLARAREMNTMNAGFHIHVAEHEVDEYDSLEKCGERVVDRLLRHGILGEKTIVAHGVHVDAREMQILADTGTWVTHQPRSNMNNAVGMPDVAGMLRMGCKLALGNDGFSNNMWEEWKVCYLAHKLWHCDPRWMGGDVVKQIAIDGGGALASQQFSSDIGYLREGAKADLIFVDYEPITPLSVGNLPWHILFGFRDTMVTMTMVDGTILMKDGEWFTIDLDKIYKEAGKCVPNVWARYQAQF